MGDQLIAAAFRGNVTEVQNHLRNGVLVNYKNLNDSTALIHAAKGGHVSVAALLLDSGAEINARDDRGGTALMWSARNGFDDVVSLLLQKWADIHTIDNNGHTALHYAASLGELGTVTLLLGSGIDVDIPNHIGRTALGFAVLNNHIDTAVVLLENGADVDVVDPIGAAARDASWETGIMGSLLRSARVEDAATAAAAAAAAVTAAHRTAASQTGAAGVRHNRETSPPARSSGLSDTDPSLSRDLGPTKVPLIPRRDIVTIEHISSGGFSTILKGQWCGCNIAMKILPCSKATSISSWTALEAELTALYRLRHPRVLSYKGLCGDLLPCEGKVGLVMEFAERGSLYDILHGPGTAVSNISNCGRLRIAADIVEGMRFLHQSCVVHLSLKSSSVFIDSDGRAKIANFGLSHFRQQAERHGSPPMGTVAWNAPEIISGDVGVKYSADVYSFGVIMWELWTGCVPWAGKSPFEVMTAVVKGKRLALPESCSNAHPTVARITEQCMGAEDARPTFMQLHIELGDHLRAAVGAKASTLPSTDTALPFPLRYICPIGYEVMVDPVVCADGHTYERSNIERWLKQSDRSPKTNLSLRNTELFPNLALKEAIEEAVLGGDYRRSAFAPNDEDH